LLQLSGLEPRGARSGLWRARKPAGDGQLQLQCAPDFTVAALHEPLDDAPEELENNPGIRTMDAIKALGGVGKPGKPKR
jgi:hypothetical protein